MATRALTYRSRAGYRRGGATKAATGVNVVTTVNMETRTNQLFGFLMGIAPQDGIGKKLTNVEAQRIMAVMDEMLWKTHIMCWVPTIIDHLLIFSKGLSEAVVQALRDHETSTMRLQRVRANTPEHVQAVADVQATTRNLVREFRNDARSYEFIQSKMKNEKGHPQLNEFKASLKDLKLLLFERLLTTVEQQKSRSDHLAYIIDKERKASEEVDRLTDQLDQFGRARQEEFDKHQIVLTQVNREIHEIKTKTAKQERQIVDSTARSQEIEKKEYKLGAAEIQKQKAALEAKLKTQRDEHKAEELALRRRKWKIESEVRAWVAKYDDEMGTKQDELEDLMDIFNDEKKQFSELQKRHADLKVEYDRIEEERRIQREMAQEREEYLRKMIKAAKCIQAIWRGFRTRRLLKQKLKKLQGKGSAKKKKK